MPTFITQNQQPHHSIGVGHNQPLSFKKLRIFPQKKPEINQNLPYKPKSRTELKKANPKEISEIILIRD